MRYDFLCSRCADRIEVVMLMSEAGKKRVVCEKCGANMHRDFNGINVGGGRKQYHRPIVSSSLAINPCQAAEHRQLFPDVELADNCMPVFDNYTDHDAYLEQCNIEKVPQKKKKRGKRIA